MHIEGISPSLRGITTNSLLGIPVGGGWDATPEEQRVKFINIAKHVIGHEDYKTQVENNQDA
jgi:hypothetical protein